MGIVWEGGRKYGKGIGRKIKSKHSIRGDGGAMPCRGLFSSFWDLVLLWGLYGQWLGLKHDKNLKDFKSCFNSKVKNLT